MVGASASAWSTVVAVSSFSRSRFTARGSCAVQASASGVPSVSSPMIGPQMVSSTVTCASGAPFTWITSSCLASVAHPFAVL